MCAGDELDGALEDDEQYAAATLLGLRLKGEIAGMASDQSARDAARNDSATALLALIEEEALSPTRIKELTDVTDEAFSVCMEDFR